jgi:hypothetical protein
MLVRRLRATRQQIRDVTVASGDPADPKGHRRDAPALR